MFFLFPYTKALNIWPSMFQTLHHPTHYYLLLSFHQAGDTEERVYSETVPTPPKPSGISICISTLNNFCTCWTSVLCCIISSGYKAPCLLLYCQIILLNPVLSLVPKGVKWQLRKITNWTAWISSKKIISSISSSILICVPSYCAVLISFDSALNRKQFSILGKSHKTIEGNNKGKTVDFLFCHAKKVKKFEEVYEAFHWQPGNWSVKISLKV